MDKINWGSLPPVDDAAQVTRAMLDMRKAKPFVIDQTEIATNEIDCQPVVSQLCSGAIDIAKLIEYIQDGEAFLSEANASNSDVEMPPVYPSLKQLSDSSLPKTKKSLNKSFKFMPLYPFNIEDVNNCLKQGIALTAVSMGFHLATSTALDVLTDVTHSHINTLCQSLRAVLDVEAKTGKTAFYDSVDQVLHDMDIGNISNLKKFFEQTIIEKYERFKAKSKSLQNDIQTAQSRNSKTLVKVKQEMTQFRSSWVPVTSIASNETVSLSQNLKWKPFVKEEPQPLQQQTTLVTNFHEKTKLQEYANVDSSSEYWPSQKRFCH